MRVILTCIKVFAVFALGSALHRPGLLKDFRHIVEGTLIRSADGTIRDARCSSSTSSSSNSSSSNSTNISSKCSHGGAREPPTCTELENRETFFLITAQVGTPPETFSLVADTGSGSVIVPSCTDSHPRFAPARCFAGFHSATFSPPKIEQDSIAEHIMTFGSGRITAHAATDVVTIAQKEAMMQDSLMLMVDADLDISGLFEGILGLGQPHRAHGEHFSFSSASRRRQAKAKSARWKHAAALEDVIVPGFLEQAGVARFSICFNDGDQPGVLRFGVDKLPVALGSVGEEHWALDFRGVSVGSQTQRSKAIFCTSRSDGSKCTAIPDTGTTVMMGPKAHIETLLASICDAWPRCLAAYESDVMKKHQVFQKLLHSCAEWDPMSDVFQELPNLHFHLRGHNGTKTTATLSPWAYVFETGAANLDRTAGLLAELAPDVDNRNPTVCMPALGVLDMDSGDMDPVWILGTPLFYEYVVTYDRTSHPPSVAFRQEACGRCRTPSSSFVMGAGPVERPDRRVQPRRINAEPRMPTRMPEGSS